MCIRDRSDYLQNTYICLNGLEIYDMENRLLHKEEKLKYEDGVQLADLAKKYHIDMIFFFKDCLYILEYGNTGIINDHFMTSVKNEIHDIDVYKRQIYSLSFVIVSI